MPKPTKALGTFTLAMITMAAIVSLRNLSLTAELGYSAVFYLILAACVFFIPTALVIAELAAAWPHAGGCYVWVGEAFGKPFAFLALWMSWMASVAWFPAVLAFMAAMVAHMLAPVLPNLEVNVWFVLITMLAIFWGATLLNFIGIELSGLISSAGVILGTLIPGFLIIAFGIWWVIVDNPMQIPFEVSSFVPRLNFNTVALFAGVLLSLAGVELAAYHIREAEDPQHSYPRAILLASFLILFVYIFGTMAIAMVVPQESICLASGLIQAFQCFFTKVGLTWFVPILALCLFLGALAGVNAWVIGPAKGMLVVAHDHFLPPWLDKVNKHGVPTRLLVMQAIIGSVLSFIFIYIRNNSTSIWFLTALSAQFTFVTYMLIFAAGIYLRRSQPDVVREFKTPVMNLTAGVGFIICLICFFLVYSPHSTLISIDLTTFSVLLTLSFILLCLPVVYFILHSKKIKHTQ